MRHPDPAWFVYILSCSDGSLYTGITTDLERRIQQHNSGNGAKYTRGRRPVELIYSRTCDDHSDALKQEHSIKRMSKQKKWLMIEQASETESD